MCFDSSKPNSSGAFQFQEHQLQEWHLWQLQHHLEMDAQELADMGFAEVVEEPVAQYPKTSSLNLKDVRSGLKEAWAASSQMTLSQLWTIEEAKNHAIILRHIFIKHEQITWLDGHQIFTHDEVQRSFPNVSALDFITIVLRGMTAGHRL